MPNVLILGGGLQALAITKSLFNAGHHISIATSKTDVAYYCRYVHARYAINDKKSYSEQIYQLIETNSFNYIIPMGDKSAEFLSLNKNHIRTSYNIKCAVPDYDVFNVGYNKHLLMEFCKNNNINHPKTAALTLDNIEDACRYVGFPALIKPNKSVGARGIKFVNSIAELKSSFSAITNKYGDCTLQQYIDNKDEYFNVVMYRTANGDCSSNAIIKIIRKYPLNAGSSCFCISTYNERILSLCKNLLDRLNWHGLADMDVLWDKINDEYYIIEINPRVPASIRCAMESGVDFGEVIIRDLSGKLPKQYNYQTGIQLRYLGLDIVWFIKSSDRFKCIPSWFKFSNKNLFYQDCYKDDPKTFILGFFLKFSKLFHR